MPVVDWTLAALCFLPLLFAWWPCGGCTTCVTFSDNFNRGDSTNLGGDWVEAAGDAEIVSSELEIDGTDLVVTNDTFSELEQYVSLDATVLDGDRFSVVLGYKDTSNYYWVRFAVADNSPSENTVTIEIYERIASADTLLAFQSIGLNGSAASPTFNLNVIACLIGGNTIKAYAKDTVLADASLSWTGLTSISGGNKVGVRAESDTVQIDNFEITECGCKVIDCKWCSVDLTPTMVAIEVPNDFTINNCGDCPDFSATYMAEQNGDNPCLFESAPSSPCSGADVSTEIVSVTGGHRWEGTVLINAHSTFNAFSSFYSPSSTISGTNCKGPRTLSITNFSDGPVGGGSTRANATCGRGILDTKDPLSIDVS